MVPDSSLLKYTGVARIPLYTSPFSWLIREKLCVLVELISFISSFLDFFLIISSFNVTRNFSDDQEDDYL